MDDLIHKELSEDIIGAAMKVLNFKFARLGWKRVIRSRPEQTF